MTKSCLNKLFPINLYQMTDNYLFNNKTNKTIQTKKTKQNTINSNKSI